MEEHSTCTNLSYSGLLSKDLKKSAKSKMYSVNAITNRRQNDELDLRKLSSRIICSANITRQNLNRELNTSITSSDDEDEFFQKLKSEIDKDLLLCSKENYKPNNYQATSLLKKKRSIIDEQTLDVIKRFKKDINHNDFMQTLGDVNIVESNCIANSSMKKIHSKSTNRDSKNIIQKENVLTSNLLDTNFRSPTNKYIFHMSSKIQRNNVLSSCTNKTDFIHTEYEEFLFYAMMFLTPPDNI